MARPKKLIQLYLTNLCNSHCKTCNIWKTTKRGMLEIPAEKVIDIIKEFPDADYVFGGGEFTLYSDREFLLEYCDRNDISYTVLSNGINTERLEDLLMQGHIENLTISCDGVNHDEIRGIDGNLTNIKYLVKQWKDELNNLKISYTLSKFNENTIDEDMQLFRDMGFEKIYFCLAQDMDLLKVGEESVSPQQINVKKMLEYKDMLYDKDVQFLYDYLWDKHRRCDSTQSVHTIYTNGDVVRCQSKLSSKVIGNIYKADFKSILHYDAMSYEDMMKNAEEDVKLCPYNDECNLVCQRRYDYEDRI